MAPYYRGRMADTNGSDWHTTACVLCSINCGIEVRLDGREIVRVRGDKSHPASRGYTCEKGLRVNHYQNGRDRISSPLRRRPDGTFEEIDWDTAIAEVAERFGAIRDEHGGASIFYYGGGGQGNHLGGGYSAATRAMLGSQYSSNALAQEKTGEFWVDGQLFGSPRCHTAPDFHHAEVAVFVGKNVWHSHGFPRARVTLKEIANDPDRAMIVIDPRRTETADLADFFLQVRPGGDAWLLAAMVAILIDEGMLAEDWLDAHSVGADRIRELFGAIHIGAYCRRADVPEDLVRQATRRIGTASSVAVLEDLGVQMAPHSTLNSWLEKLLYLLTGNFARQGGMNLHSSLASLSGGGAGKPIASPVHGHRVLSGLVACNHVPDEILTDHPERFRAMLVESANPAHSLADSGRWREALDALELVVVIDVAMTETARRADYVLPAASQYEKVECTFFTLEFPENDFQLRHPILEPLAGTLPEPEIHSRLVKALGGYTDDDLAGLRAAAHQGRSAFAAAFFAELAEKPHLNPLIAVILYETLGRSLPHHLAPAAALWGLAHRCAAANGASLRRAGFDGDAVEQGEALFDAILENPQGIIFTVDPYEETWNRIVHPDQRAHLVVEELVPELAGLADDVVEGPDPEFPLVLSAGERRSSTANTVIRDPGWRKKDPDGALRISVTDATSLGVVDGGRVRIVTRAGQAETVAEVSETMRAGHVSLPNGFGLEYPDELGEHRIHGVAPNELTSIEDRDWFAGTPHHKHIPARVEALR